MVPCCNVGGWVKERTGGSLGLEFRFGIGTGTGDERTQRQPSLSEFWGPEIGGRRGILVLEVSVLRGGVGPRGRGGTRQGGGGVGSGT